VLARHAFLNQPSSLVSIPFEQSPNFTVSLRQWQMLDTRRLSRLPHSSSILHRASLSGSLTVTV